MRTGERSVSQVVILDILTINCSNTGMKVENTEYINMLAKKGVGTACGVG